MTHQVETDQIAQNLLVEYPGADAYGIAQHQGLWLQPRLGVATELRGRVITFDVTLPDDLKLAEVLRCVVQFVVRRDRMIARLASLGGEQVPVADELAS